MKLKVLFTTVVTGIVGIVLGQLLFPPSYTVPRPSMEQMPFFIILILIEGIAFGLGVSLLLYGRLVLKKIPGRSKNLKLLVYLSLIWSLVNWLPHDNLHAFVGTDLHRLLYVEYGFHLTLILSSVIVLYYFLQLVQKK